MKNKKILFALLSVLLVLSAVVGVYSQTANNLKVLLIDLKGWDAEKANGMSVNMGGMKMANAFRVYNSKERKIQTTIMMASREEALQKIEIDTKEDSNYKANIYKISGFTVTSVYDKNEKDGTIVVTLLKDEGNYGAVFAFHYNGLKEKDALGLVQKFNWKKMKKEAVSFLK